MLKWVLIIMAVVLFVLGNWLMNNTFNAMDIGLICVIASMFFFLCFILSLNPMKVEARSPYQMRGAGISQQMNIYLYRAVNYDEPPEVYEDDIDFLARLITSEFGYSNNYSPKDYERGCYLTGSVVINRLKNPKYPNTLEEVIYQTSV